jgi:hypothetical protein
LLLKLFAPDLSDRLPQLIADFLQPALNPKTMVTDFTVQLPFKSGPQKERAERAHLQNLAQMKPSLCEKCPA